MYDYAQLVQQKQHLQTKVMSLSEWIYQSFNYGKQCLLSEGRDREKERDRETQRDTERQRERQTERDRQRQRQRQRQRVRETETDKEKDRERERACVCICVCMCVHVCMYVCASVPAFAWVWPHNRFCKYSYLILLHNPHFKSSSKHSSFLIFLLLLLNQLFTLSWLSPSWWANLSFVVLFGKGLAANISSSKALWQGSNFSNGDIRSAARMNI